MGAPSLSFTADSDTGLYRSAANTVDIAAGGVRGLSIATVASGVNYINVVPAVTTGGPDVIAAGSDTNIDLDLHAKGTGMVAIASANTPFRPGALSGTPIANGLYRENVVKAWISFDGTGVPAAFGSFNVTSITDNGVGTWRINVTIAMVNTNYVCVATAGPPYYASADRANASAFDVSCRDSLGVLTDAVGMHALAIGPQ